MMLAILEKGAPILKRAADPFDFATPQHDPRTLAENMAETMIRHRALGLAAPQVGFAVRMFVMKTKAGWIDVFNPEIIARHGNKLDDETCLSFPGQALPIVRAEGISARWVDHKNKVRVQDFSGLDSRVFQHEYDHLDGITVEERVTPAGRALAMKRNQQRKSRR
jgi:peptide deformylase